MVARRCWKGLSSSASPLGSAHDAVGRASGGWGGGPGRAERTQGLLPLESVHPLPEGPGLIQPLLHAATAGRVEAQTGGRVQVATCVHQHRLKSYTMVAGENG